MKQMQQPKIDVQSTDLATLLNQMGQGHLQIPRFQRRFVWSVAKTRELLDSMMKEFPIGTFFFWQAPDRYRVLFREIDWLEIPKPKDGFPVTYILDGQQRLTSLYVTVNGINLGSRLYDRICVDLDAVARYKANQQEGFDETLFVYRKPDNEQYVSLTDLLSEESFAIYPDIPDEWQSTYLDVRNRFLNYPFSVVWVKDQPLGEVVEIFQRINQGGKRLSRYDLVCANLWREDFDFRRRVAAFNRQLGEKGFGEIDETIVTQAFALILLDRCTKAAELSLESEQVEDSWNAVINAIELAIDFAEANLGVKRYDFLPYRGILAVLAYYFYYAPKSAISAEHRATLWQWFWRVSLSERYSSASPSRMAEDAQKMRGLLNGDTTEFNYPSKVTSETVAKARMTTASSALRNAVLCMLALRGPKNLKDGSPVNVNHPFFSSLKKSERHHIFPVSYLKKQGYSTRAVHRVPNFCFIPADLNKEISATAPSQYLAEYRDNNPFFETAAASHLIPVERPSPVWEDDYGSFLDARSGMLARELNALLEEGPSDDGSGEFQYAGQEKEIIERIELQFRDLIHTVLYDVGGDAYWNMMPGNVIRDTKRLINKHLKEHPYEGWEDYPKGRARLDFCGVGHYEQIILKNWTHFEHIFRHRNTFQKHMADFRDFRNSVFHMKEMNEVQRDLATAAVRWIQQTFDKHAEWLFEELEDEGDDEL